jgi:Arc/MetJ-type ribon-helix-helix transcriptional regulator
MKKWSWFALHLLIPAYRSGAVLALRLDLRHTKRDGGKPMPIQLSPESERLVEQEIASGRFQSVDEIIQQGLCASDEELERWKRHRQAIAHTREFMLNRALPLNGITIKELIEEGRRM